MRVVCSLLYPLLPLRMMRPRVLGRRVAQLWVAWHPHPHSSVYVSSRWFGGRRRKEEDEDEEQKRLKRRQEAAMTLNIPVESLPEDLRITPLEDMEDEMHELEADYKAPPHEAAMRGDVEELRRILEGAEDHRSVTRSIDSMLRRPLHYAAASSVDCVDTLLSHGAQVDARDECGEQAIHLAAGANRVDCIVRLIAAGADVNAVTKLKEVPLHLASRRGALEAVEKLLEEGALVSARDGEHQSPLSFAVMEGCKDVAECLLEHGADPNEQELAGQTPLHLAAMWGNTMMMRVLLYNGARVNVLDRGQRTPLHQASCGRLANVECVRELLTFAEEGLGEEANVNARDKVGRTPLHYAAMWGNFPVVDLLLQYQAEVNVRDIHGYTPLLLGVAGAPGEKGGEKKGHHQCIRTLLSCGADTKPVLDWICEYRPQDRESVPQMLNNLRKPED